MTPGRHPIQAGLTNHHRGEDDLLWPLLRQRVDVGAEIVARMEREHGHVATTIADALRILLAWQRSAAATARDELAVLVDAHRRVLTEHLDDEEAHLLPLAARHLTGSEWAALGDHFVTTTPKADLLLFLGAVLEEATDHERAALLGAMPLVARLAWRTFGRRRYTSHMREVRETPVRPARPIPATSITEV